METIGTALTAAETGHLVFATLHTQDAPQTIDRIIDVFPPAQQGQIRAQLAIGLQGIVTQTLLPTADGHGRCVAAEVLVPDPGRAQPDPRGQDAPDLLADPDRRRSTACRRWTPRSPASSATGTITMAAAETRSVQPAELRRLVAERRHDLARPRRWLPDGRRGASPTRPSTAPALPRRARSTAPRKDAVIEELQGPRPDGHGARREEDRPADGDHARAKRVKAAELTVMTRQLATMISSGMTLLRAFYVLEEQVENKKLKETRRRRPRGHRGRPRVLRRARQAPEGLQPALRRHGARRRGRRRARGVARPRSPTSSRRTTRCAARSRARWPTRPSC